MFAFSSRGRGKLSQMVNVFNKLIYSPVMVEIGNILTYTTHWDTQYL